MLLQISTSIVSREVEDQRMDAGDTRWWKKAYYGMQVKLYRITKESIQD